jgi:hypothetical protein
MHFPTCCRNAAARIGNGARPFRAIAARPIKKIPRCEPQAARIPAHNRPTRRASIVPPGERAGREGVAVEETRMSTTRTDRGVEPKAPTDLRGQYRAIGIEAVAAALHYGCQPKNDAYAPVKPRITPERYLDPAA